MRASGTAARSDSHQTLTSHDVAGHTRVRRTGSIGFRLMLPVVAASLGLLAGGAVLVMTSVNAANDAHRARVLVDGAAAALRLVLDQVTAKYDVIFSQVPKAVLNQAELEHKQAINAEVTRRLAEFKAGEKSVQQIRRG